MILDFDDVSSNLTDWTRVSDSDGTDNEVLPEPSPIVIGDNVISALDLSENCDELSSCVDDDSTSEKSSINDEDVDENPSGDEEDNVHIYIHILYLIFSIGIWAQCV